MAETAAHSVLLIDDEAHFRTFIRLVLKQASVTDVREAADGREGVKRFQESAPGLVLLDINMPHMDGIETLTALRQLSSTVPIIMLTSVADERMVEQCVEQGATFFIRKDVPPKELAAALSEFLQQKGPFA